MNTLREIGHFVGEVPSPANPSGMISLRSVQSLLPVLSPIERTSMRAMIAALQRLPPLTLDVEVAGNSAQVVPFIPVFQLAPSACSLLSTTFTLLTSGGVRVPAILPDSLGNSNAGGPISFFRLNDPGEFVVRVTRIGISSSGIGTLEKSFKIVARVKDQPPPPPPPPPHNVLVTCSAEQAPAAGAGGITNIRIFGGGFEALEQIGIVDENAQLIDSPIADQFGNYQTIRGFLETSPVTHHTAQAHGQRSGRTSNIAGFFV
jgi:hypothetical protein